MDNFIAGIQARAKVKENLRLFDALIHQARDILQECVSDEVLDRGGVNLRRELFGGAED